jgi:hypothetical protein
MDYAVLISAVVLGLSVLASLAKFLDWFLHSDPKTMARTLRLMMLLLLLAGIPLIIMMIVREQWAGAMLLGAVMVVIPTFLKWNLVVSLFGTALSRLRRKPAPFEMPPLWPEEKDPSPPSVREAAAILEAYVAQHGTEALPPPTLAITNHSDDAPVTDDAAMRVREALEVLGLADGADLAAVHAAHRRLMRATDPDAGGSAYLATRVDEARDTLVVALAARGGPAALRAVTPRRLTSR